MSAGVVQWRRWCCIGGALLTLHVQGKFSASLYYCHLSSEYRGMTVFNKHQHGKTEMDERSVGKYLSTGRNESYAEGLTD